MPEQEHRVAVRAYYLLAASAFTVPEKNQFAGVNIAPHGKLPGVLLTATTGAEMAFVYDEQGTMEGAPLNWRIHHPWFERELAKIAKKFNAYDLWAIMSWSPDAVPVCSVTLVDSISGENALRGRCTKVKTLQRSGFDMIVYGQVTDDIKDVILGATPVERSHAPTSWFFPNGMQRIEQFSAALNANHEGETVPIAMLRTARSNMVQVAFRDHDEAAVFLATTKDYGQIRTDNPSWLDSLL